MIDVDIAKTGLELSERIDGVEEKILGKNRVEEINADVEKAVATQQVYEAAYNKLTDAKHQEKVIDQQRARE